MFIYYVYVELYIYTLYIYTLYIYIIRHIYIHIIFRHPSTPNRFSAYLLHANVALAEASNPTGRIMRFSGLSWLWMEMQQSSTISSSALQQVTLAWRDWRCLTLPGTRCGEFLGFAPAIPRVGSLEDALIATGIQSVSDLDFTITTMISSVTLPASDKVHAFLLHATTLFVRHGGAIIILYITYMYICISYIHYKLEFKTCTICSTFIAI